MSEKSLLTGKRGMVFNVIRPLPSRMSNAAIGVRCGMREQNVTRALRELEEAGLIHRTWNANGDRVIEEGRGQ